MKRNIIRIDEDRCDGCGLCLPNCPEGAIQLIDGKVRLMRDSLCDGLGACLGQCPRGAITLKQRDADPYEVHSTMANVIPPGNPGKQIHSGLLHITNDSKLLQSERIPSATSATMGTRPRSQLSHWPIQLHLLSPKAPHYQGADLLLAADCVPFALATFHEDFLKGRALAIGCPKLDDGQEIYVGKLMALVEEARVKSLTVIIMEVPCCGGLLRLAREAVSRSQRKIPIHLIQVSLQGNVLQQNLI